MNQSKSTDITHRAGQGNWCVPCESLAEDCTEVDATPAPLDPSKVKAGDTVTVVVAADEDRPESVVSGLVWEDRAGNPHNSPVMRVGTTWLGGPFVTLTDHQPAPEPEPVWKPGDMAAVTARGWINGWSVRTQTNDGWASHCDSDDVRSDAEVESVRPLVVIDPAAARESLEMAEFDAETILSILLLLGIEE